MASVPGRVWPTLGRSDGRSLLILAIASAILAFCLWCKLQSLLYLDPSWWLQELSRAAHGELPYRDFAWHFPPFAVLLYGYALRLFGIRFGVVQVLMDAISFAIVVLSYLLLRRFMGAFLACLSCLLMIAVCCTTLTYFSLFSLFGYSPALQTGALGLLFLLNGVVGYADDRHLTAGRVFVIALGACIALLSKPEPIVATLGIMLVLIVFNPRRSVVLLAVCLLPAIAVYGFFAHVVGLHAVAAAISGYGLATNTCPWWPTGIGIWAGLAGCGAAAVLVGVSTRKYAIAGFGLVFYLSYEFYARSPSIQSMASTTEVFRAVLWPAILYWTFLVVRGWRQRGLSAIELKTLLLLTAPVLMSARSLFGTVLTPFPEVPAICYPFVTLLGPYLLYQASSLRFVTIVTSAYIAIRIVAAYPEIFSDRHYSEINTIAGKIKVNDVGSSREIYDYVVENTAPSDGLLEIPYGGGIGFASGRRSPTYSTLFVQLSPPESIQSLDIDRIRRTPPALVIAKDAPRLGSYYGVDMPVGCEFPRVVWKSEKSAGDEAYVLSVVNFIEQHYYVERRIGGWQILRLNR